MSFRSELGNRMKVNYEIPARTKLTRRTPVAIRLDGKAFHSFTKGFKEPFDDLLMKTMQGTTLFLCRNVQGCVLGYTQSDEITLILTDYETLQTTAWFDYRVEKLCSISASLATLEFNRRFRENLEQMEFPSYEEKRKTAYEIAARKGATFDSRCFNIPKEEVCNLLYWRQLDASKNSVQMAGRSVFSHRELVGKSCNEIQDMLHEEAGINWNNYPTACKRGSCVVRSEETGKWVIDKEIPLFKGEGREYIDSRIFIPKYRTIEQAEKKEED